MDSESAADEAVRNINGTNVKGRSIKVEKSESKGPRKPSKKLFVGNLAEGISSCRWAKYEFSFYCNSVKYVKDVTYSSDNGKLLNF